MPRTGDKIGSHRTTWSVKDGILRVVYCETEIVVANFHTGQVELDNGGYETNTTKRRMEQVSNQFGLGFSVFSKKGKWYAAMTAVGHDVHARIEPVRVEIPFSGSTCSFNIRDEAPQQEQLDMAV